MEQQQRPPSPRRQIQTIMDTPAAKHTPQRETTLTAAISLWRGAERTLLGTAIMIGALTPASIVLALIDGRTIDGSNLWLKPLKFQISVAIFLATLAFMVPLARASFRRSAFGRLTIWTAIATSAFEIAWITGRAAIGERSHYASDTAFGGAMYALMGLAAVALSLTPIAIIIDAIRADYTRPSDRILRWGATLGAVVGLVGASAIGMLLGGRPSHYPTDAQDAASRLPVAGWSLDRGDLRIAHFVGLHAMQGLPLIALFLVRAPALWSRILLTLAALAWLAATLALAGMALEGQSPFDVFSQTAEQTAQHPERP